MGYNIFSDDIIEGSIITDYMGVNSAALSLGELQLNGGFTPTLLPNTNSLAINAGNPSDITAAQNGPIVGVRDVGSAEQLTVVDVLEFEKLSIQVYPNPSSEEVTISSSDKIIDEMIVYNALGQLILTKQNFNTTQLVLNKGVYFVEVLQSDNRLVKKVVIK